jgi:hypothetical protein
MVRAGCLCMSNGADLRLIALINTTHTTRF